MTEENAKKIENTKYKIVNDLHDKAMQVNYKEIELSEFIKLFEYYKNKYKDFEIKYVMYNDYLINNIEVTYRGSEWYKFSGTAYICMNHDIMKINGLE